jgi:hypothetical protein
VDFSIFE